MSTLTDDITKQAHQGNVVALVQVLNSELAEIGVKTRAVFVDNILQLLCEATQPEQLERWTLVARIENILKSISPRHIHQVRINSRLLQRQQLLWFEEINRNPNTQLLWYEDIFLKKPSLPQRLLGIIQDTQYLTQTWTIPRTTSTDSIQQNQPFQRGLVGGMIVSLAALLVSFGVYQWLSLQTSNPEETPSTPVATPTPTPAPENQATDSEKFTQAVRLAQEAVAAGEIARTRQEWSEIAETWGEAAELMEAVSPEFSRYATAQNRASLYRRNQEVALEEAAQESEFSPY
ncbi:hypothetical protein [Lyngbya sp. PCC 8106]|uniref:hypothetical protein n=1 Tax=Lyngbya sp. (strain PCC 8106) TaxID=313612 RepID=UPI0000EAD787|nr:hypothetical protein [Lyngbya sp. PCC 8106]EAW37677.1 hypothetical protein L8106_16809 [Lyngbya sp. PCC 8106]